jgi:hypothetical protein
MKTTLKTLTAAAALMLVAGAAQAEDSLDGVTVHDALSSLQQCFKDARHDSKTWDEFHACCERPGWVFDQVCKRDSGCHRRTYDEQVQFLQKAVADAARPATPVAEATAVSPGAGSCLPPGMSAIEAAERGLPVSAHDCAAKAAAAALEVRNRAAAQARAQVEAQRLAAGISVTLRGVSLVPGAIVCQNWPTLKFMFDWYIAHETDVRHIQMSGRAAVQMNGPPTAEPPLNDYGCVLVPNGTAAIMVKEPDLVLPTVSGQLASGERFSGITLPAMYGQ